MTQTTTRKQVNSWQQLQPPIEDNSRVHWDTRTLLVGTAVGAAIGLAASWLLVRTSRETLGGPPSISTGDALKVGITTIGLVRAIAALGDR
ncbi:MAG: hypothetical protein R3C44_00520 [Chloroflexota bacterium]